MLPSRWHKQWQIYDNTTGNSSCAHVWRLYRHGISTASVLSRSTRDFMRIILARDLSIINFVNERWAYCSISARFAIAIAHDYARLLFYVSKFRYLRLLRRKFLLKLDFEISSRLIFEAVDPDRPIRAIISTLILASAFWYQLFLLWMPDIFRSFRVESAFLRVHRTLSKRTLYVFEHHRCIAGTAARMRMSVNRRNDFVRWYDGKKRKKKGEEKNLEIAIVHDEVLRHYWQRDCRER